MGLFDKRERCAACLKPFEDHAEYVDHITNLHPKGKPCTKCSGTAYWFHQTGFRQEVYEVKYICPDCGFILETWGVWEKGWSDKHYIKSDKLNRPVFK